MHSHTLFSDGVLTPNELISRAIKHGVTTLAITDHDTLDAYRQNPDVHANFNLVTGIELSTQWQTTGVHVLGLNVDLHSDAMSEAVSQQSNARMMRARQIAEQLEKKGIKDAFSGAGKFSTGSYIGRPHFARYLVEIGKVNSIGSAFKKYMGDGKAGDVKHLWADLLQVIQWIRDANGIAVLAHPLKYKLTRTRLKRLLETFVASGGQGMEVISGQQIAQQTSEMAKLCDAYQLLASCGSDFHMPDKPWSELGRFSSLPGSLTPVWERF